MPKLILVFGCLFVALVSGLYEDQIGKFDWKQQYIGVAKYAFFDPYSPDEIVIASEENVIGSVRSKTGELVRRVVLEDGPRGEILLLQEPSEGSHLNRDLHILTVSGRNPSLVRGWDPKTFNLEFEWNLNLVNPAAADDVLWFYNKHFLYHVIPVWGSHLELVSYIANSGETTKPTATKISASWIKKEACILAGSNFVCLVKNQLLSLDLLSESSSIKTVAVESSDDDVLVPVPGAAAVRVKGQVVLLESSVVVKLKTDAHSVAIEEELGDNGALIEVGLEGNIIKVTVSDLQTGNLVNDLVTSNQYPTSLGSPTIVSVKCKTKQNCRILLKTTDESIVLVQQGKVRWTREESLTNIDAVDFVDLALSDAEGELEEELKNKGGNFYSAFIRRISGQIAHAKNIFLHVIGAKAKPSATQKAGLIRDDFGLHKIIVVVTRAGKLFGIDNLSGKQHWVKYLPSFEGFNDDTGIQLVIQRGSKYYPLTAQCSVIGKQKKNGNGIVYQFNPLTGQQVGQGVIEFSYPIQQFILLNTIDSNSLKGLLFLDNNNQPHVIPESSAKLAHEIYVYTADRRTGVMAGYSVQYENAKLQAVPTWRVQLGSIGNAQKIVKIASKNAIEHVHSQGRVLADRSVLYKYLNPNLVAVVTQGNDPIHKYILNVHLLDVVSGAIIFSLSHKRCKGPINIVHSENWVTYSFFNEKVRRFEVTSVELYEGKTQSNSSVWSSLGSPPLPLIERQIYIMPANITVMRETITEKGITNKHLLFGLSSGSILEMAWAFLDPRRPSTNPEKAREEGIIPYIPELPIPSESIVNYNQTVERLRGIHTSPSGLESTSLVIAYGLDVFVTRVSPSKTFDLLKEDFDYFLISIVLIGLISASYITKHLAAKKIIKQAWK